MLAAGQPAVTVVTMEAHRSPAAVAAALAAGSHVLLEKPGCMSLADFEPLAAQVGTAATALHCPAGTTESGRGLAGGQMESRCRGEGGEQASRWRSGGGEQAGRWRADGEGISRSGKKRQEEREQSAVCLTCSSGRPEP